jgi:hypothetical protein
MRNALQNLWALLSVTAIVLANRIPSPRAKKAISQIIVIGLVVVIIVAGSLIVYFLVVTPSSTSSYP